MVCFIAFFTDLLSQSGRGRALGYVFARIRAAVRPKEHPVLDRADHRRQVIDYQWQIHLWRSGNITIWNLPIHFAVCLKPLGFKYKLFYFPTLLTDLKCNFQLELCNLNKLEKLLIVVPGINNLPNIFKLTTYTFNFALQVCLFLFYRHFVTY